MSGCRIYVACLAAYNDNKLHGAWIDVPHDTDELGEAIEAILAKSPVPDSEEWAIHDHEGLPTGIGENPELDKLCTYAELSELYGDGFRVYIANVVGWHYFNADTVDNDFWEAHSGEFDSERAFAEHCVDEGLFGVVPEAFAAYIDYDAIARDLFCGDYTFENGHVFRRC